MSNLSVKGTIQRITDRVDVSKTDKPFIKRELWLEIPNGNYPQMASFEATQDRCDLLDAVVMGQQATVHFNINGREWNDKVFNSLNLWKIEAEGAQQQPQGSNYTAPTQNTPQNAGNAATEPTTGESANVSDDLPF